jgi:hypothetical protein
MCVFVTLSLGVAIAACQESPAPPATSPSASLGSSNVRLDAGALTGTRDAGAASADASSPADLGLGAAEAAELAAFEDAAAAAPANPVDDCYCTDADGKTLRHVPQVKRLRLDVEGPGDKGEIARALRAQYPAFSQCYAAAIGKDMTREISLTLLFTIGKSGHIGKIDNGGTDTSTSGEAGGQSADATSLDCVLEIVDGLTFTPPSAKVHVSEAIVIALAPP